MTDEEAELAVTELAEILRNTESLLLRHNEQPWAQRVAEWRKLVEARDFRGVELISSSFGGMGSFNDLLICGINGHRVSDEETDRVNDRLRLLQHQIYKLVGALSRYWISNSA